MSLSPVPWDLSNPVIPPWLITVVIVVLVSRRSAARMVSACGEVVALVADLLAGGTATKYSNHSNRPCPHASS